MQVTFGSRPNGFALDGITGMGGNISPGPKNITIGNSTFVTPIDVEAVTTAVVLDQTTSINTRARRQGLNAKIFVHVQR